jgi:hypothetical protein
LSQADIFDQSSATVRSICPGLQILGGATRRVRRSDHAQNERLPHTERPGDQIYSLADWYVGSNFMKEIPGRVSRFRPPDFMAEGVGDALDEKVAKFNEWVDQKTGLRNLLRISENWTDLNQEPKDNEFMNLEAVPDGDLEIAAQADAEDQIIGSETDLSDTDSGTLY